jgi:cold shock protein
VIADTSLPFVPRGRTFAGGGIHVLWWSLAAIRGEARVVDPLLERTVRSAIRVREVLEVFMTTGTIKKVVADRGFGFIAAEDSKEYFFHRGGLDSSLDFDRLMGGERVQFEVEASPKGPRATQVRSA